jgi:hypothetical protein
MTTIGSRYRMVNGLRTIGRDLQRIVEAGRTCWRYLRSPECVDLGLGMFSAASPRAAAGQPQRYQVRIANASEERRAVTLSVDIYAVDRSQHPERHYACFTRRLTVDPRTACPVDVEYDWRTTARFVIGAAISPPDAFWRGEVQPPQLCLVQAIVYGDDGRELDKLIIYQEVSG